MHYVSSANLLGMDCFRSENTSETKSTKILFNAFSCGKTILADFAAEDSAPTATYCLLSVKHFANVSNLLTGLGLQFPSLSQNELHVILSNASVKSRETRTELIRFFGHQPQQNLGDRRSAFSTSGFLRISN